MKCPKCHYLSFDPEPRCRNCGYDLELQHDDDDDLNGEPPAIAPDLPMTTAPRIVPDTPADPLADMSLRAARPAPPPVVPAPKPSPVFAAVSAAVPASTTPPAMAKPPAPPPPPAPPVPRRVVMPAASAAIAPAPAPAPARPSPFAESVLSARTAKPAAPPTTELPLFVKGLAPEEPAPQADSASDVALIKVPAPPPPLSVRRDVTPAPAARAAASRKLGPLDRDLLEDLQRLERAERREARTQARETVTDASLEDRAGAMNRLGAAAIDALLLGALSAGVVWATLRWCGLSLEQVRSLPIAPMAGLLALVFAFYLLLFTAAGGQTLGKMALGIRVVADDAEGGAAAISIRQAVYRALLTVPSVLALGAGFVPALVGDERALHDRLVHTRVVRA